MMGMHILLIGNPVDGVRCIGPFKTGPDAIEFANANFSEASGVPYWWIAELEAQSDWAACQPE